ncbi:Oleandomycin polyketide synthase, partial [Durusdinium trenchii]
ETLKSFGLSSFGFGGTNTHVSGRAADTEAVATAPAQEMLKGPTLCISWSFRWQKVDNRLNHAASLSPEMKSLGTWRLCPSPSPEEKIVFNRQRFGWSQTKHPLSVQPRRGADDDLVEISLSSLAFHQAKKGDGGVMVFAAPIKGKVLQLLSHHIIYGEIVVPGSEGNQIVCAEEAPTLATSAFRLDMAGKKFALENIGALDAVVK